MNIDCRGCKHDQPGDCSAKTMGEDGYFHFPEGKCHTEHCGKINSGVACTMPVGSKCPDCGVSLHDFGGHD